MAEGGGPLGRARSVARAVIGSHRGGSNTRPSGGSPCKWCARASGSSRALCCRSSGVESLGAASCEHGNRYDGEGLSFFKNSSGRNSNIWIYNCLNLIDLSLKNVLLMARSWVPSWWTSRKRRRPEDEGAPVVHVFQGEGRRRLKRKGTGGCISVAGISWRSATL